MARVRFDGSFRGDLEDQLAGIRGRFPDSYIDELESAIGEVVSLLTDFPSAGAPDPHGLRKLVLRRLPFVVWYVYDEATSDVWLLRVFRARQDRPHEATKKRSPKRRDR